MDEADGENQVSSSCLESSRFDFLIKTVGLSSIEE